MLNNIWCKLVLSRDYHSETSWRIFTAPYWTVLICFALLSHSVTPVVRTEVCGGVRSRFICDDHDPAVFHICLGNNQYTMMCPGTLHFNSRTQNCDWPDSVNCVNETRSRQPTSNTVTVSPTLGTRHPPVVHKGDYSASRARVVPTSTSFAHPTTSQVSSSVHTMNASKLLTQETVSTELPHSRYRLKVVPSTDKPLESLLPADEKVIEEVKKLSEELKHIDNYLQSLESDNVGFMIEPYMAAIPQRRPSYTHRYPKPPYSKQYTTSSFNPYRKSLTSSTSPFRKITSSSPYRINTATFYRSKSTSNPRTHRVSRMASAPPRTNSPYRPKTRLYRTDSIPVAYRLQNTPAPAPRYSYRFSNNRLGNNYMGHKNNPYRNPQTVIEAYKTHGSKYNPSASNKQYAPSFGKNEHRFGDRSTPILTQRTYAPHQSTAKSASTSSSYRKQGAHKPQIIFDNKTTRKSQLPYINKTTHKPQILIDNKSTRKSQMLIDNETKRKTQMLIDNDAKRKAQMLTDNEAKRKAEMLIDNEAKRKVQMLIDNEAKRKAQMLNAIKTTRKFQVSDNKTTRKIITQDDNKTTRFQSTRSASTYKQPSIYKSTSTQTRKQSSYLPQGRDSLINRHGTFTPNHHSPSSQAWWSTTRSRLSSVSPASHGVSTITARTSPNHYSHRTEQSHKPVETKVFTSVKSSSTTVSHPWWSSTKLGHTPVSHPATSGHLNSGVYTRRHYHSRPNYNTRTPNFDVLSHGNERSASYRSHVLQNEHQERPFNAPAAVERNFALHSASAGNERSFSLYQVTAPASVDRFALHKPHTSLGNREMVAQIDKIFPLDKDEDDPKDKMISAYKSPVEKYETKQGKCSSVWCKLPDCRCIGSDIPGDFDAKEIPQMVMLTFDDSINGQNMHYFSGIFNGTITNPNGCPIKSTFFVSGDSSDYDMVKRIYKQGHEIASHTLSHRNPTTWWAHAGYENWEQEIIGMRDRLNEKSGVPVKEIIGMRAPFLQVGGDAQYAMLKENKFRYDSSMVTGSLYINSKRPIWPFTLDTPPDSSTCSLTPCPTRSYPGLWEVPLIRWYGSNRIACAMPDACTIGLGTHGAHKFIEDNFNRHYTTNRAPFGVFIHASWFGRRDGHFQGLIEFLRSLSDKEDVWVVTVNQALDWIQRPVRLSALNVMQSWAC